MKQNICSLVLCSRRTSSHSGSDGSASSRGRKGRISQEAEKSPQRSFQIAVGINERLLLTLKPKCHRSKFLAISERTRGHKGMSLFCLQALISLFLTLSFPIVSQQESRHQKPRCFAICGRNETFRLTSTYPDPCHPPSRAYPKWYHAVVS